MADQLSTCFNLSDSQSFILLFPNFPKNVATADIRNTLDQNHPFFLQIYETVIPAMSFEIDDTSHVMKHREITGRITFESWSTSFLVDELWSNYRTLFKWLQYIDSNIATDTRHSKDEYKIDATLEVLTKYKNKVIRFDFVNLSPVSLGEVGFTYQETRFLTCDIKFEYDYIKLRED